MSVIWITGLPGVGKTTIAGRVVAQLRLRNEACVLLDGDRLRQALAPLAGGYDIDSRWRLAQAYAGLAQMLVADGLTVVVATVSLFADVHASNRMRFDPYLEVLLECDETERLRRRAGSIVADGPRVGIEIPASLPHSPDLRERSDEASAEVIAQRILECWRSDAT